MDYFTPRPESQAEAWASPTKMSADSLAMIRSTMQEVLEKMACQSSSASSRQQAIPRRLNQMISKELKASDGTRGQVLVELAELLFLHCRDQVFLQHGLERYIERMDSPEYKQNQQLSLQRCMYLYSQLLYANAGWGMNDLDDKRCFETLYVFLSKVVHSCIQQTLETRMRGAANISCQAYIEEEIGRLFRSPVFNTFNAQRAKQKEKNRKEAMQNKAQQEQDSLDALLKQNAQKARQASEASPKQSLHMQRRRDLREAACARSPMLAAVLPSAQAQMQAVNQKSTSVRMRSTSARQHKAPVTMSCLDTTSEVRNLQNSWALCKERAPHLSYQHSG